MPSAPNPNRVGLPCAAFTPARSAKLVAKIQKALEKIDGFVDKSADGIAKIIEKAAKGVKGKLTGKVKKPGYSNPSNRADVPQPKKPPSEPLRPKTTDDLPGPTLPNKITETFRDNVFRNRRLANDETWYKYHGKNNRTGREYSWITNEKFSSEDELRKALAIDRDWGIVIDRYTEFRIPKGTWISEGHAASQGIDYPGGGWQGVIKELPNSWVIRTFFLNW